MRLALRVFELTSSLTFASVFVIYGYITRRVQLEIYFRISPLYCAWIFFFLPILRQRQRSLMLYRRTRRRVTRRFASGSFPRVLRFRLVVANVSRRNTSAAAFLGMEAPPCVSRARRTLFERFRHCHVTERTRRCSARLITIEMNVAPAFTITHCRAHQRVFSVP